MNGESNECKAKGCKTIISLAERREQSNNNNNNRNERLQMKSKYE